MGPEELKRHVAFSVLTPAARIGLRVGIPLREMKRLIELAYYRETRIRRLKMREVRKLMAVSMSKVGMLSRQLKDHFIQPEAERGLQRRILSLLWAAPMTEGRIVGALGDFTAEEVTETLRSLAEGGMVLVEPGRSVRYSLAAPQYRLVSEPWMAKIDGLNHLMVAVSQAIESRFFEDDEQALVRTLSFRVRDSDLPKLRAAYEEHIYPLVIALDEAAVEDPDSVPMNLTFGYSVDRDTTSAADEDEPRTDEGAP